MKSDRSSSSPPPPPRRRGAWQVGPAFGAIYKGLPEWLFGCLIQDPISFTYTSSHRRASAS
jgi:hypothetical protein